MAKQKGDDGRADELAIQAELLEVVGVLEQQREQLGGLLKRANKLPSYRRVNLAWNRGDEHADSVGWQLSGELTTATTVTENTGAGPVLGDVIQCLRSLAELTPEACAVREAEERESWRQTSAMVAEENRRAAQGR